MRLSGSIQPIEYMDYFETHNTGQWIFDLRDEDTYWCTADIGWVTGHSYIVYGPLQNGASVVMYEGAPNTPDPLAGWPGLGSDDNQAIVGAFRAAQDATIVTPVT